MKKPAAVLLTALALSTAGCAYSPASVRVGETADAVRDRVGSPPQFVATPEGERWIYPTGPLGQFTYAVDIDKGGRVQAITQILTDELFATIRKGEWDKKRVHETFGPPAEVSALPRRGQEVWSYRYKQDGVWNSLMHVYFDARGTVENYHPGPDPMFEPREIPDALR